jgi:hypothetical protein
MGIINDTCGGRFDKDEISNISFAFDSREISSPSFSRSAHRFSRPSKLGSKFFLEENNDSGGSTARTNIQNKLFYAIKDVMPFDHLVDVNLPESSNRKYEKLNYVINKHFETVHREKDDIIIQPGSEWEYYYVVISGQLKVTPHTYIRKTKMWEPNLKAATNIYPVKVVNSSSSSSSKRMTKQEDSKESNSRGTKDASGDVETKETKVKEQLQEYPDFFKNVSSDSNLLTKNDDSIIQWSFGDAAIWGRSKESDEQIVALSACTMVRMKANVYRGL